MRHSSSRTPWCALVLLLGASCAHEGDPPPSTTGTTNPTRVPGLPALPFALAQSSPGFQRLYEGVRDALLETMPEVDASSEAAYRRYVEGDLVVWLEARGDALRAASRRADALDAGDDAERGIGHGLVAYLHEQTAEAVVLAPVPNEAADGARALRMRDAWRTRLAPVFVAASRHWRACAAALALPSPELALWKRRCDDEAAEARSTRTDEGEPQPEDTSTVGPAEDPDGGAARQSE